MEKICSLCQGRNSSFLFEAKDYISESKFEVWQCQNCGVTYTLPQPPTEEIKKFYPREYFDERKIRFNFLARQFIRIHQWTRIREILIYFAQKIGRMLDIGCGRGWQLKYFKEKGWEVLGTELSEVSSSFARRELKLEVTIRDIRDCCFKKESFDVVTLWHVLEHLYNPKETLWEIWRVMKKEGMLFISVPNFASWQARITQKFWFHLDCPRHLWHFLPLVLERLLEKEGFKIISRSFISVEYGYYGIIQSLLNLARGDFNFLWDLLTLKGGKIKGMKRQRIINNLLWLGITGPICIFLGVLLETLSWLFKGGAVITLVVRKKER